MSSEKNNINYENHKIMVYDCFAFFNELDLLELRLHILNDVVDKFVLVEGTRTFQNKKKELIFEQNKDRFKPFLDKIIHIVVDKYPAFNFKKFRPSKPWDYDNYQKEFILKGLKDCAPDDVIIISDVDEIPVPEKVIRYKEEKGIKVFEQLWAHFFINYLCVDSGSSNIPHEVNKNGLCVWKGTVMMPYKSITTIKKTRQMRGGSPDEIVSVEEGGWHLSFLGGTEKIVEKLSAYAHTEYNKPEYENPELLEKALLEGKSLFDIPHKYKFFPLTDKMFPKYLLENKEKFQHFIREV